MPTNDFIGFASSGAANVMSQADYAAAAEQTDGVQPGPASSAFANKVWRQGANMAAAFGQIIASSGFNALDNGDIADLVTSLKKTLQNTPVDYTTVYFEDVSVPSSTTTNLGNYTFSKAGIYFCKFTATFETNTSNQRRLMIATTNTGSSYNRFVTARVAPVSDGPTIVTLPTLLEITTANTKLYFNAYQTSGSTLGVSGAGAIICYLGGSWA